MLTEAARSIEADLTRMQRLVLDQLRRALAAYRSRELALAEEVIQRDDVVDALNLALEEQTVDGLASAQSDEGRRLLRAALKVSVNLERAGDAACHIAKRARLAVSLGDTPVDLDTSALERLAALALDEAMRGFLERDPDIARRACLREPEIDATFIGLVDEVRAAIAHDSERAGSYLHVYSVMKYLEKIGDYALNIGEQALFLITGRRLKFAQFQSLDRLGVPSSDGHAAFRRFWDGISGAVVAEVAEPERTSAVYKEGMRRKIADEATGLERWQQLAPGLAPRVLGTVTLAERMALLREFVDGTLLSDLLFSGDVPADQKRVLGERLAGTLAALWERTVRADRPADDYIRQIEQRLDEVYALHPYLEPLAVSGAAGGGRSMTALLRDARLVQADIAAPISVWLHGDLNANNVIVSGEDGALRFIDVHRSHYGDALQDVGVFLVSLVRVADLSAKTRAELRVVASSVELAASLFAKAHGDAHAPRRLALSRARSLITSARVVVESAQATMLFTDGVRELAAVAAS